MGSPLSLWAKGYLFLHTKVTLHCFVWHNWTVTKCCLNRNINIYFILLLQSPINSHTHYDPLHINTSPGSIHTCLRRSQWMRLEEDDRPGHVWRCVPAVPSPAVARAAAAQSSGSHSDLFLPSSHPQHGTAQCAPQPVPWLEAGAWEPSPAIRPPEVRPPNTSWPSPAAPWSPSHQWHLPPLQLSHAPWTQDTLCGPNLPSQQLQVTKHPRLLSCFSLWFSDTKMQR